MAANRDLWDEYFSEESIPAYPCPSCRAGRLNAKEDTFSWVRLGFSERTHHEFGYHPREEFGRFTFLMVCTAVTCREVVAVSGKTFMSEAYGENGDIEWMKVLEPQSMCPGPPLMEIPNSTPAHAAEAMRQAFSAFWADRGSAANRLRISVERIMDSLTIPTSDAKGELKLFARINKFGESYPDYKDTLDALRHIGNLGSHDGDVSREALMDVVCPLKSGPP